MYRINQSLENAIVTAPFYVLHARDTREEGGRGRRGARPKFRENSWKRPRRETRRGTNDNDVPKTIDIDRAIEGKWWKNMQSRGGERREGGRERRGEKWRGEEEIGGGEDDKKREKEGGWMAERYGIWEMRTRFFSFFLFFFLFFSFFSFFLLPPVDKADLPVSWPPSRIFSVSLSHDSLMHELLWTITGKERWRGEGVEKHVVRFMIDLSVDDKLLNWSTIKLYLLFTYCIWQCVCGSIVYLKKGKDNI